MVNKNIEFLQPAACIVVGIWPVNLAEQHFLIANSCHLSAPSSKSSKFSESGTYSRIDLKELANNKNATAIVILTVFPVDNKVRKRETFLVEDVTFQPGYTD